MAGLVYHQATFQLLGIEPVISPARLAVIAERERICGVRFPEAVKEWMSIEGVETLFHENTNNDYLPSVGGEIEYNNWKLGEPADTKQGYLCVAWENQAVVIWYVRLDEGDNPPVYHDNGETSGDPSEEDELTPLTDVDWVPVSETFSSFIYHMVAPRERLYVSAGDRFPTEEERQRLRSRFHEALTGTPMVHWFIPHSEINIDPSGSIHLQGLASGEDRAMWFLAADSEEAMRTLVEGVWDIASLAQTLQSSSEEGQRLLEQVRAAHGAPR